MRIGPEQIAGAGGSSSVSNAKMQAEHQTQGSVTTQPLATRVQKQTDVAAGVNQKQNTKHGLISTLPQDQVNVKWDSKLKNETLVYELTDERSGAVLLQLPTDEVLSVSQAIGKELHPNAGSNPGAAKTGTQNRRE